MFSYKANQRKWIKVSLSFLVFYFGEAVLFWKGGLELGYPLFKIPFAIPYLYPVAFWGLFGFSIYLIQRVKSADPKNKVAKNHFAKWQNSILTIGITTGVIGLTMVVMHKSGSITLGHTALFYGMFICSVVMGGIELNIGWLSAALCWFLTAILINNYPDSLNIISGFKDEDFLLGLSIAIGFFLIGALPYYMKPEYKTSGENFS
jgi:hypothetical protein